MSTVTKPREFRNVLPLPCLGSYEPRPGEQQTACFLGPEQMVCQEREKGGCIAEGLLPIPVPKGFEGALLAAMRDSNGQTFLPSQANAQLITDRNAGLFDHLQPETRKGVYNALRNPLRHTRASPRPFGTTLVSR
jgi:hypothetical protein